MQKRLCYDCKDFSVDPVTGRLSKGFTEGNYAVMRPVYWNVADSEGKREWVRIGFVCERCHGFDYGPGMFKPKRHAV